MAFYGINCYKHTGEINTGGSGKFSVGGDACAFDGLCSVSLAILFHANATQREVY